jgi:hypothetical protein
MSASDYWENVILDLLIEANLWVGYSTADPLDDASGLAEPAGGYARQAVTAATWDAAASGSKDNGAVIEFPVATDSQGTITHLCLFDAVSGGHLLASGALTAPVAIASGETPRFAAGAFIATMG